MAAPTEPHAIPYRALVKQLNGPFKPRISGNRFALGTFTLSNTNSPVADARRLHFPWVVGVENPSIPLSTTRPRITPSSSLAQTTATVEKGALLIHILLPFRMTWSPASLKLLSIPLGSLP